MTYDHTELFALVRELLEECSAKDLSWCIQECHDGRLHHPIDQSNLHLFRRYRNTVTGHPQTMINEAIKEDRA